MVLWMALQGDCMRHVFGILGFLFVWVCCSKPANAAAAFSVNQNSVSFQTKVGTSPASASVIVTNLTNSSLQLQVSTSTTGGGSWLGAGISNPIAAGKTGTLTISPTTQSLQAGNYSGTVTVTGSSTSVVISVSLSVAGMSFEVSANNATCFGDSISNPPVDCSFQVGTPGTSPSPSSVSVANLTSSSLQFQVSATTTKGGNWLGAALASV
jgi:hypothetical protein